MFELLSLCRRSVGRVERLVERCVLDVYLVRIDANDGA